MFNSKDILNAANYESLCNYSFIPPYNKFGNEKMLYKTGTIFCKTDYIDFLFQIIKKSKIEYNLLTHHSDYPIDEMRFNKKPKNIKKWFAINPTFFHPDLIPIPLGIKTHKDPYYEPQYMSEWFIENINTLAQTPKTDNIYCNWNNTNPQRQNILNCLKKTNLKYTHQNNIPFKMYIQEMAKYKFVLSPPGNGIDCHRTWEALYCGCIPIVIKNFIYDSWDLPILQVNSFDEITQEMLNNFTIKQYNKKQLTCSYWANALSIKLF
jgi:hypothetical protein